MIVIVVWNNLKKRKSSKDDSLDLEASARVTFSATADETEESDVGSKYDEGETEESDVGSKYDEEGLSNESLHKYLDEVINEVSKKKVILHRSVKIAFLSSFEYDPGVAYMNSPIILESRFDESEMNISHPFSGGVEEYSMFTHVHQHQGY
jgi:hypothetical protein